MSSFNELSLAPEYEAAKEKGHLDWAGYQTITLTNMVWVFFIGSVIGFLLETGFALVTRGVLESRKGVLYGPICQIYGSGAVVMALALMPFSKKGNATLFFGGALVGGLFEGVCSYLQELVFGSISWEYSDQAFSFLGGRTSLMFMFFWGVLAVVYMRWIYPAMIAGIRRLQTKLRSILTVAIALFLVIDLTLSAGAVGRWSMRQKSMPPANQVECWLDAAYPDERMKRVYPNMQFLI